MAITVEINGKTYTFRNLEEQVLFLTKELTKVQQSLGNALPDPIPGPPGEPGATGGPGPEGPRGTGVFGCSSTLPSPSAYKDGDLYVLFDGSLYKKVSGNWVKQTDLRGPQGPIGLDRTDEVVANPIGDPTEELSKVEITGTVYDVLTKAKLFGSFVKIVDAPESTTLTDEQIELFREGCFINGTFLGLRNPIFIPCEYNYDGYYGIIIGNNNGLYSGTIRGYRIDSTTKVITLYNYKSVRLDNIEELNGVVVPNYPSYPSNPKVLIYKSDNSLEWQDRQKDLYQHNITITFNDNNYIVFTIVCNYDEPIVDISELLDYKYQLEQLPALYFSGQVYDGVVINLPQNGDFSFDVGGGNQTYDYDDDITDITDHFVKLS